MKKLSIIFFIILLLLVLSGLLIGQEVWTAEKFLLGKYLYGADLSPDGQWVAYNILSYVIEEEKSYYFAHIWISAVDGSQTYQLTRGEKSCEVPVWSPDGKWIAFITDRSGSINIWLISPRCGEAFQLIHEEQGVSMYKWSPDSKYIAFLMKNPPSEAEKEAARTKVDPIIVDTGWHNSHIYKIRIDDENKQKINQKLLREGLNQSVSGSVGQLDDRQAQLVNPFIMMPRPHPETNKTQHKRFAQHIGSPRRGAPGRPENKYRQPP